MSFAPSEMTVAGFNRLWSKNQDNNPYSDTLKNQKSFKRTTSVPKRLVVCCDGTWFASDKGTQNLPSNVARIARIIAKEDDCDGQTVPQIVFYQSGVGTGNLTWVDKRVQGKYFLCNMLILISFTLIRWENDQVLSATASTKT